MAKTITTYVLAGGRRRKVTIRVPGDEPKRWEADTSLRIVGKPIPRIDALEKVMGTAR